VCDWEDAKTANEGQFNQELQTMARTIKQLVLIVVQDMCTTAIGTF